jgi:hypothetical protein
MLGEWLLYHIHHRTYAQGVLRTHGLARTDSLRLGGGPLRLLLWDCLGKAISARRHLQRHLKGEVAASPIRDLPGARRADPTTDGVVRAQNQGRGSP